MEKINKAVDDFKGVYNEQTSILVLKSKELYKASAYITAALVFKGFARKVYQMLVLVLKTLFPDLPQKLVHGVWGAIHDPCSSSHGITLHEELDDLGAFGGGFYVHVSSILSENEKIVSGRKLAI